MYFWGNVIMDVFCDNVYCDGECILWHCMYFVTMYEFCDNACILWHCVYFKTMYVFCDNVFILWHCMHLYDNVYTFTTKCVL